MKNRDAVLALVRLHPGVSGYELRQQIQATTSYFFSLSLSRLYPFLAELTEDGLVTFTEEELLRRPARKRYTITEAGERHLRVALAETFSADYTIQAFPDFVAQLNLMPVMDNATVRRFLLQGRDLFVKHRERIQRYGIADVEGYVENGPVDRDRHMAVWQSVNVMLADDLARRIEWIDQLIEALQTDPMLSLDTAALPQSEMMSDPA